MNFSPQLVMIILVSFRNLCVKVQLVEFVNSIKGTTPHPRSQHRVLRNVYNKMPGPLFCSALFSNLWYHNKAPVSCDEFKIRLPDVVTGLHWIKYVVLLECIVLALYNFIL